jgi:hypothetical protein
MPPNIKVASGSPNLDLLALVGSTVFGNYWQKQMIEYLNMSQRHMVRWCNREWEVPDVLRDGRTLTVALYDLLEMHQEKVNAVRARVIEALPVGGRQGT